MKRRITLVLILLIFVSSNAIQKRSLAAVPDPYFNLLAKIPNDSCSVDYFNLIKQYLARIGIHLSVKILERSVWEAEYSIHRDFDLTYIEFSVIEFDPYLIKYYSENGTNNVFGYSTRMDWDDKLQTGRNEWYIQNGLSLFPPNSTESIELNWEWQQYLMDEILPGVPLFTKNNDSFSMLAFNMREVRHVLGNRDSCAFRLEKSQGLAIRKAIAYAIDREEINNIVHGGKYEIMHWPVSQANKTWCNPNIIKYCHNIEFSRNAMAVAGYVATGAYEGYNGDPIWPDWEKACPQYDVASLDNSWLIVMSVVFSFAIVKSIINKRKKVGKIEIEEK